MTEPCWLIFGALDDEDLAALADDARPMPIPAACRGGVLEALRGLRDHARVLAGALPAGAGEPGAFQP